jgi:hypothetical protein
MAGREHERVVYNDAAFILILAIAGKTLFGLNSLEDVRDIEIPD